jgi:hypothetical protein
MRSRPWSVAQGRRGRAGADAPLARAGGEISGLGLAPALAFGDAIPYMRFYPGKYKVALATRPEAGPINLFDFCCGRQRRASGPVWQVSFLDVGGGAVVGSVDV